MDKFAQPEDFGAVKFALTNHEWQYRGEGNANIAISLPRERKVIRLLKFSKRVHPNDLDLWNRLRSNVRFITLVMKQLIGPMFVSSPTLIYLSTNDMDYLSNTLFSIRPESRKHKTLSFCGGELLNDYAFLPREISDFCQSKTVCIELKPKQGIFPCTRDQPVNCSFCCKQQLKLKDGLVPERSKYCPLDLFSGCSSRMKHALMSLLCSPQNNLRIFCDGDLAYGEGFSINNLRMVLSEWLHCVPGSDLVERFSSLLLKALITKVEYPTEGCNGPCETWTYDGLPQLDPMTDSGTSHSIGNLTGVMEPCNFEKKILPEGCILQRLARAQALDQYGTSLVHEMMMSSEDFATGTDESNVVGETKYVQNIITKGSSSKLNPIELYLIAAAVRDCSILISFQELKKNFKELHRLPQVEDESSKTNYVFQIAAVDIDPKPFSCIESHLKRDASIHEAFLQAAS